MWDIIKQKLGKLGCLFAIALAMVAATAVAGFVLGRFGYDEATKSSLSNLVGEYVGKGLLGLVVLLGFILMGRQLIKELRGRQAQPPVHPGPPPRIPPIKRGFRPSRKGSNNGNVP